MGFVYRISNKVGMYFVTFTVHQWVDVFTRREYVDLLLDSLRYCQAYKGLKIYAWVIMTNHIHLIISNEQQQLSDNIRDFKKFTSSKILKTIKESQKESRKKWLLWLLQKEDRLILWQAGYHGIEIYSPEFFETKLNYIHLNPVRASIVEKAEDYLYSSCCDYVGSRKGLLDICQFSI